MKHSLGFGLERIGLPAIVNPRLALALIILFSIFCALGTPRLQTVNTLSELFESDTVEFKNYEKLRSRFPTSEFDVLVVVEGDNLLTPEHLEQVRDLHLELQFAEAVDGILSIFSMREASFEKGVPRPVIPAELPRGDAFDALAEKILKHPLIGGKLLSGNDADGQITLLVISLKHEVIKRKGLTATIGEIEKIAHDFIAPTGMKVQLAGAPVMQLEIRDAIKRDRLIYNTTGFFIGFLICLAFFRRIKLVAITSVCSAVSVLWAMGLLGWLGLELNTFINVIPPLVMVIAYTDAMHMVFSIRRRLRQGDDRFQAARHAILTVGPACVLTSLTTSIAFASLTLTDSGLIRTFGIAAGLATLLAFMTVIVVLPTLVVLLYKNEADFMKTDETRHQAVSWLENMCESLGRWLEPRQVGVAVFGAVLVGVFLYFHLQLEPRYRLSDQVPDGKQSVAASERL
ncbi:MAG: RND transporter, partial [Alphaproteobacteria bacterium]